MADKIINVNDDNVKGEGSGFKKGGEDTVTGNITGSIELRPLKLVAPGTASKDESEDLSDVLKDKYNNISELVDTVLELVKNNGALIKRLTLEFGNQEAAKKKVTSTRKKPTSKKASTAPPKKRGRPKKAAPAPVYDIGRGEIQGTEDKVEAIGTASSPEQGVSSFIESPLFFTDIDRGSLAKDKEESDKSNWALVNRDPTAFFEDLDVNWFEILLKTINNISDRLDEQTSLLNDKLFTLGDIRELVKGILTDSDRLRDLDREATEPPEMPSEASDRDEKDKDRERGLRSGRGGRSGGWLDQRLYEMTGMLVNFAGLGELDDLLGITDLVWDNAGKVWGKIKDKFKKKDKKGPETLDVDILDPEFKAEDVSPRPAIEDRVIDVESVTDDVKDRITRDQLLLPPVTWEFPEQRAGSHPVSPLGGGSGDIIDVEPLSDEDLTLLPPPPESLELVLSDEAKEYLDTIKDAKGIEGGEPVSEGLTKDDLLEALNSQKTTSSVASLSEYTHGKLVTSKDETGGLGKDGINDLKKLLKQMAGEGSMMSMASMLMLAKIAAVGATAVGGFMLGKEAFSRMAGDKYEAGLMEQVEGNLTEKAKTDKGRDIAHTKGGYEESIRNLKLQNEELKQKGDPLSLRLIEKNNRLMESYRERADELYSEGATLKALESGRDIEDVKAENISTIERLEKELEDKNIEDRAAKEEQLKYEKLLQKGLEKEEVNRAAAEAARQEAEDKLKEESGELEDVAEDVKEGITEGIEQSLPTMSEAVAVTATQATTQPSLEDETGTSTPQSIERLTTDSGAILGTSVTAIAPVIGDTIPEESTAGLDDVITELPDTVSGNIRFLHREGDEPFYPAEPLQRGVPVEQRALPEYSEGQPVIQRYGVSGDVTHANTRLGMEGAPVEQRPLEIKGVGAPVYQRGYYGGLTPFGAGINLGGIGGVLQQSGIMQGKLGAIDATLGGGISGMLSGLGTKEGISRSVSGLVQGGLNIPVSDTLQAGVHGFLGGDRTVRSLGELGKTAITSGDFGLGGYLQDTRAGQAVTVSGDLLGQVRSISQSMGNLPSLVTGKVKESVSKGEIPSTTADLVRDNEQRNTEVLEKIARIGAGAGSMLGVGSTAGSGVSGGGSVSVQDTRMGMDDIGIMLVNMGYFS